MTGAGDAWPESIEVRHVGGGEIEAFLDVFEAAWGFPPGNEHRRHTGAVVAAEAPLAAFTDGGMAGTAMSFALELTVGVLRTLMRFQLDDLHARGVPVAGLGASEAGIYRRFGYGPATWASSWRLAIGCICFGFRVYETHPGSIRM